MKLSYETAKKLKNAGFPQEGNGGVWNEVFTPSLSELIEACGKHLASININEEGTWSYSRRLGGHLFDSVDTYHTPEEAVANLFLVLKEKSV